MEKMEKMEKIDIALQTVKQYWSETDWELVSDKNGIKTERKLFPDICPIYCHRIEAIIDKPNEKLVEELWNMDEKKCKKYDKTVVHFKQHDGGENWQLITIRSNLSWPLLPRETLGLQVKKIEGNTIWLIGVSDDNDKCPYDSESIVRTNMHFGVTGYEKLDDNRTKYTKMVMMDPMGDIPTTIVNLFAGNFAHIVELLREL